jgi:hypothetical protein
MFKLEKIKAPIEVLKPQNNDDLPLGHQYINHAYPNILLLAKKNSGKTNIIYNILKKCANKHTEIVIFCPTWELDDTYRQILDYLDSKGIPHQQFKNIDNLKDLMDSYDKGYQSEGSDEESEEEQEEGRHSVGELNTYGNPTSFAKTRAQEGMNNTNTNTNIFSYIYSSKKTQEEPQEIKPKKSYSKFIIPEHIFIFDDCKKMLRNPVLNSLIATNRHYKSKVIISTQYFTDIMPDTRTCLDVICIFPKIPIDKIHRLHEDIQLSTELPVFEKLYLEATKKPHSFLYVDIRREQFKFNFDTLCVAKN